MSKRTRKGKSQFSKQQHERRTIRRRKERYLKIHEKRGPKPYTLLIESRIACHRVFDRLWQGPDAPMNRTRAYQYLQKITGMSKVEAHVARFDRGVCEGVIAQVKADYPRLFEGAA
jgi:hypothetical protein